MESLCRILREKTSSVSLTLEDQKEGKKKERIDISKYLIFSLVMWKLKIMNEFVVIS